MNIAVFGTIFVDIKGHSINRYIPDGRNPGYIENVYGGVGRNIAWDAASLGANVKFVSMADTSAIGKDIINGLYEKGIDTSHIGEAPSGCGTWLAVFNEKGDVVSSVSVKADLSKLPELIDSRHEEIFKDLDALILELDIEEDVVKKVFHYAKLYNIPVYCAVAIMSNALDKKEYLNDAHCFICNRQEAGMLFESDLSLLFSGELLDELSKKRNDLGVNILIVTMSEMGSVYVSESESGICPIFKAEVVDTTGAGDSYCAGLTAALVKGLSLKEACLIGARVSGLVVSSADNIYNGEPLEIINEEIKRSMI